MTRPVRPTLTWTSRSFVVASSGGYLNAIAQRGAREVEPSRRCSAYWSTFTTTPSISCSTECRCSLVRSMNAQTPGRSSTTRKRSLTGSPSVAQPVVGRRLPVGLEAPVRADAVHDQPQRPGGGDPRVLLPQGAGGGVARVGERRLALLDHAGVDVGERGDREVDLAAHLEQLRDVVPGQLLRDVLHGADVRGDVLPRRAVAAGGGADHAAVLVDDRDRDAVDLELAQVARPACRPPARRGPPRRTARRWRRRCPGSASARGAATGENVAVKPPLTFWLGDSGVTRAWCASSIALSSPISSSYWPSLTSGWSST